MAFEQINEFTNIMAIKYKKQTVAGQFIILYLMTDYYETVLKMAKMKGQRMHCEKLIYELNPSYYRGYFKKENP